ncbi:MAG: hypothetical protein B7Y39_19010 [Bdellovibrio sp. 28-41-41]|nr:MAG: hypothetical protein B7Y39_19010 [Bdellovibrio sp. 28-41-41]
MKHVLIVLFLLASQSKTFAEELHGIFMVVKGDVEVESKKTGKYKAKVASKVYAGDVVSTGADSRAKIVMSDRNVFNISTDSKMTINKYENDSTTGVKNVEIDLSKGKVRSNVEQKYDGEKSQFMIKTPTAVAGVRGTQFLTSFDPATRRTEIVTFKGAVALSLPGSSAPPVIVKKGETSSVTQGQSAPEKPKQMKKEDLDSANKGSNSAKNEDKKEAGDSRSPASESKKDVKAEPAKPEGMVDRADIAADLKNVPKSLDGPGLPLMPAGPPQVIKQPEPPPIPKDLIPGINLKTKVIIVPTR